MHVEFLVDNLSISFSSEALAQDDGKGEEVQETEVPGGQHD